MYSSELILTLKKKFSSGNWALKNGNQILESLASFKTENSHIPKYVLFKKENPNKNNKYTEPLLMLDTAATLIR